MAIETISWLFKTFIEIITANPIHASFLGGLFAGEEFTMFLAFLSARGAFDIWIVFVFSFIGVLIMDFLFYFLGRLKITHKLMEYRFFSKSYNVINSFVSKITKENRVLILLYTKFIVGTRIITLIYLGVKKIDYRNFILVDILATFIWAIVVVSIGYLIGKGYTILFDIFKNTQITLTFVFFIIFIYFAFRKWLKIKFIRRQNPLI